ncbi:MAG: chromosome segregation protein SMC [Actinobacteria bacterium]|nr:chromosome segregation protein SMC [Actinomycetota bacterium]
MFLKSLTIRGFKSFADRTELPVEPGITVIVGPNGSGKSNVVDALSWVLGTASPKKLRGGQMADVIFAGSPTRNPLGHATVEIVIDNSDGQLGEGGLGTSASAKEFAEVRVSREIFPTGENVYRINGEECRALDVQELLSDTGLGRELHTIIGQGQLDAILNAKPEDRRAFIEEAAGILKHRRRRERAVRKLEQVDVHIDKLRSILRELRRQLRPLERQAEAANKLSQLQAELRDVRVTLVAHDAAVLASQLHADATSGEEVVERLVSTEQAIAEVREREQRLTSQIRGHEPRLERAHATYHDLRSLLERVRGTGDLIEAKRRHLIEFTEEPLAGRPPAELRAAADRVEADGRARDAERDEVRRSFEEAVAQRRHAESARREYEQQQQAEARRRAEQRERVLRWEGEVSALRGSIASAEAEAGRVGAQLQSLDGRIAEAEADVQKVQDEIQRLDTSEVELTAGLETAEVEVAAAQRQLDELLTRERELERERSSQSARAEALRAAEAETSGGAAALLESGLDGVVGRVADALRVPSDLQAAFAAALGPLGEAVLVTSPEGARRAVGWLREVGAGRAVLVAVRGARPAADDLDPGLVEQLAAVGAIPIASTLQGRGRSVDVVQALRAALGATFVVDHLDAAILLHGRHPRLTFVTRDGDIAGPWGISGGSAPERSAVLTAAAADEAEQRVATLSAALAGLHRDLTAAREALARRHRALREATDRINESDARITGAAERLARVNKELAALQNQRDVIAAQHAELAELLVRDRGTLDALVGRGPDARDDTDARDADPRELERLDADVETARELELEVRVQLERLSERIRNLETTAADLRREADDVERALAEAARRREARQRAIVRCRELSTVCDEAIAALGRAIADAEQHRDRLDSELRAQRQELERVREREQQVAAQLEEVREERHAADLRRADLEHRREQLATRAAELGLSLDELDDEQPAAFDADRDALTEREDLLVRRIGLLGRVNPLALEEFQALEERHAFLSGQLDDLRRSKRDLEQVIEAVDDRIRQVFMSAFEDVAHEFETVFGQMFPGGHGRLVLTDPDEPLTTGVEVEARPPGKRVKRLSLLSGGERSLTVLAFVFAIFRARPSPFYVLDEVDAALDDANIIRLVDAIEAFKERSQLIVVTHQRRTMEIADVLYGVTMNRDGISKVVAQRLEEGEPLSA